MPRTLAADREPAAKRAPVAAAEGEPSAFSPRAVPRPVSDGKKYRTAKKYPPRGFLPRGGLSQSGECAERRTASLRGRPSVFCAGLQDPCSARHSFCTAHNSFPAPQVRGRRRKTLLPAAIFRFCNVPYGSRRSCAAACRYAAPRSFDPCCSPGPVRGAARHPLMLYRRQGRKVVPAARVQPCPRRDPIWIVPIARPAPAIRCGGGMRAFPQ